MKLTTDAFFTNLAATMKCAMGQVEVKVAVVVGNRTRLTQLATINFMRSTIFKISRKMNSSLLMSQQQQAFNLMGKRSKSVGWRSFFATGWLKRSGFDARIMGNIASQWAKIFLFEMIFRSKQ